MGEILDELNYLVSGKGKHKPEIQQLYEDLEECGIRRYTGGGYCSEKNLMYLKENGIWSYIKLQDKEETVR